MDPALGRFLQREPALDVSIAPGYAYASNSIYRYVDPLGLCGGPPDPKDVPNWYGIWWNIYTEPESEFVLPWYISYTLTGSGIPRIYLFWDPAQWYHWWSKDQDNRVKAQAAWATSVGGHCGRGIQNQEAVVNPLCFRRDFQNEDDLMKVRILTNAWAHELFHGASFPFHLPNDAAYDYYHMRPGWGRHLRNWKWWHEDSIEHMKKWMDVNP